MQLIHLFYVKKNVINVQYLAVGKQNVNRFPFEKYYSPGITLSVITP